MFISMIEAKLDELETFLNELSEEEYAGLLAFILENDADPPLHCPRNQI